MEATKQPILVGEANPDRRTQALAVLILVAFGGLTALQSPWYGFFILFAASIAMFVAVTWKAFIELDQGTVREEARLFGKKLLGERRTSLAEFDAVVTEHCNTDPNEYRVGIRHRSGRKIWMRTCQSDTAERPPGRYPESVAWQLSCETGLEIEEYVPPRRGRWLRFLRRR